MNSQTEPVFEEKNTIDLQEIFHVLIRHLWLIIAAGMILGGCVFIYTNFFVTPEYQSTTKVYVLPKTSTTASGDITNSDLTAGTQLTKDYIELVKSRPILEEVINTLNLDMTTDELSESITAVAPSDTRILTIKVINPNPETARDIADTLRELVSNQLTSVMNVDSVNTIENASLPVKPISPDVARYTLLGFVIGVLAAFIYFIVSFIYDDTVKTPDDIEQKLGYTTLAVLPSTVSTRSEKKHQRKIAKATFHKAKGGKN